MRTSLETLCPLPNIGNWGWGRRGGSASGAASTQSVFAIGLGVPPPHKGDDAVTWGWRGVGLLSNVVSSNSPIEDGEKVVWLVWKRGGASAPRWLHVRSHDVNRRRVSL
jgi:hypothetical protein